jgi:DUF4097 and DUF4098 domain-containing protein YvlB
MPITARSFLRSTSRQPARVGTLLVLQIGAATAIAAQQSPAQPCSDEIRGRDTYCEVREFTLSPRPSLVVDARPNGGIRVTGSDDAAIRVRATVRVRERSEAEARQLASQVEVRTTDGEVRATGPEIRGRDRQWSVSYEVSTPRRIDLDLQSVNGGIDVEDVQGRLAASTINGGITLNEVAGDVRGRTTNGGISVDLAGERWSGEGLDLRTTNGGINLTVPSRYSAHLVASTVNGGLSTDLPLTVRGRVGKQVEGDIGGGGAPVRLATTNGGIRIRSE